MSIHPTALVEAGAAIDPSADIGPYCIIGAEVRIGPRTRVAAHVIITGRTTLGADNQLFSFACLGNVPQDRKYDGEPARLLVGDRNVFRESVTVNIGTAGGRMQTTIGDDCLLMATSHVAHDCSLGDGVVMANGVALAGHVDLHDGAILGGLSAVHQFCRIGRLAFVGGGAMVAQDVPPFCVAQGDRATIAGLNLVGLRRAGWTRRQMHALRRACQLLCDGSLPRQQALALLEAEATVGAVGEAADAGDDGVRELCTFVREATRGVCGGRRGGAAPESAAAAPPPERLELVARAR